MTADRPGVAIIGCGLIGQKRARAFGPDAVRACVDPRREQAEALAAGAVDARTYATWEPALERNDINLVVVATPNDSLAPLTIAALRAGKHVLVEKPAARFPEEIDEVLAVQRETGGLVRVGFNHRYHPGFRQARDLLAAGALGPLMFIRARYGHGGRVGYDREWRANPAISGGGELIDQGVHLIDLARWFLGDFTEIAGCAHTYYWSMPVDDNAFLMLHTAERQTAFLQVSCTEWKNLFSFEIYGRDAKLHIEGLGGSYGTERLAYYRMLPAMGPPETTIWEYPREDDSWRLEIDEFLTDIRLGRSPTPGLPDALAALRIVQSIYQASGYDHHP